MSYSGVDGKLNIPYKKVEFNLQKEVGKTGPHGEEISGYICYRQRQQPRTISPANTVHYGIIFCE